VWSRARCEQEGGGRYAATTELTGSAVMFDPGRGRVTVRELGAEWLASNPAKPPTAGPLMSIPQDHIFPALGDRRIDSVVQTDVQSLVITFPHVWPRGR